MLTCCAGEEISGGRVVLLKQTNGTIQINKILLRPDGMAELVKGPYPVLEDRWIPGRVKPMILKLMLFAS